MGDILPPKRQTVVDRLRRRIEHYRRHQGSCVPRYEQTLNGLLGQHERDTFLLRQRFLESKAKKSTKKSTSSADHTPKTPTSNAGPLQSVKYKRGAADRLGSPIATAKLGNVPEDEAVPQQPSSQPPQARTPQQQQQQQQQPSVLSMDQNATGNSGGLTQLSVEIVQQFTSSSASSAPQIQSTVTVTTVAGLKAPVETPGSGRDKNLPSSGDRDMMQEKMANSGGLPCKQEPQPVGLEQCSRVQVSELSDSFVSYISPFGLIEDSTDDIMHPDTFNDLIADLSPDLITDLFEENVDPVHSSLKGHEAEDCNPQKDQSSDAHKMTEDAGALGDPNGLMGLQCVNGGFQVTGGNLNFGGPQNQVQGAARLPAAQTLMQMAEQHQNMKQKQQQQQQHHPQQQQQQQQQQQMQQQPQHMVIGRVPYTVQQTSTASEYPMMHQYSRADTTPADFMNTVPSSFMNKNTGPPPANMFPFASQSQQPQHHHHQRHQVQQPQHQHHHHNHQQVTFQGTSSQLATGSPSQQTGPQAFGTVKTMVRYGNGTDCGSPVPGHVLQGSPSPGAQYMHSAGVGGQMHHQMQQQQQHYMNAHQIQVPQQMSQGGQQPQQQVQVTQGQQMRIREAGKLVAKPNQPAQLQQQQQRVTGFGQQHATGPTSADHFHMTVGHSQATNFRQQPTNRMSSGNGGNVPLHFTAKIEPNGGHGPMQQTVMHHQLYDKQKTQHILQQQQLQRQPAQIFMHPRPPPPEYMVQHQMTQQQEQMVHGFPMAVRQRVPKSAPSYTRDQRPPNVVIGRDGQQDWRHIHGQSKFSSAMVGASDGSACAVQGQQRFTIGGGVRAPRPGNSDMSHGAMLQMQASLPMNVMSDLLDGAGDGFLPSGTDFNLDFLDGMESGGNGSGGGAGGSGNSGGGPGGSGGPTFNANDANELLCSLDSGTTFSILEGL